MANCHDCAKLSALERALDLGARAHTGTHKYAKSTTLSTHACTQICKFANTQNAYACKIHAVLARSTARLSLYI